MMPRSRPLLSVLVLLAAAIAASQPGCVRRRMTIHSNPPGARVMVDNYEIGTTPCSTDFTYYGTRDIRLIKDGYETLTVKQAFPVPWYQYPVIEFVAENLVPYEIRDERHLRYAMVPQVIVPTEHLLGRAEALRRSTRPAAAVVATPALSPPRQVEPLPAPPGAVPPPLQPTPTP